VQQYLLRYYPQLYLGLYGTLLVLIILFEPLGLTGLFNRLLRKARPDLSVTGVAGED
jgi:branched-chain amino acid transport system permease protein